jgi:hypothetical protein
MDIGLDVCERDADDSEVMPEVLKVHICACHVEELTRARYR